MYSKGGCVMAIKSEGAFRWLYVDVMSFILFEILVYIYVIIQ